MFGLNSFALSGHIAYTPTKDAFCIHENGCLVCVDGQVAGVFDALPQRYKGLKVYDFGNRLIIPGLCDTHVHASQYAFRGLGMDLELLQWLNTQAFPQELQFEDEAYAKKAYGMFVDDLRSGFTTRAAIFATVHVPATLLLMGELEKSGLCCLVGNVNMDRNAPDGLLQTPLSKALDQTESWIEKSISTFKRTKPIITPRFIPSCTDEMMQGLGALQQKYNLPVQSHLSENKSEIEWVKELCPWATCYADAYAHFGLLGNGVNTVMAHCVHPTDVEVEMLKARDVLVSHCPASNADLTSGIAPVARYLDAGMRVGLGTDVAGGFDLSVMRAASDAVQFSKLRAHFAGGRSLKLSEAFYMATKGGGTLFGQVGSFEPGYAFDALVLDDSSLASAKPLTVLERLERAIYLEKQVHIISKYVQGSEIMGGAA